MWCNDPFLSYLQQYGYSVIRLPKADVRPMQVLAVSGKDLDRLGDLTTLLVAGQDIPPPPVSADTPAANISGQRTSDMSIGVGLSILGSIIGAMGGSKLGLEAKYGQANTAAFEFHDVLEDRVEVIKLDQYLGNADVNPFSRYVGDLLDADELYVTTSTIKSRRFTVEARKSNNVALELSVPEIQGVVGASIKVSGQGETSSRLTYEGPVPLVFGFQAVRLFYDNGRYTAIEPLQPGGVAMRGLGDLEEPAPNAGAQPLVSSGPFVRLRGD